MKHSKIPSVLVAAFALAVSAASIHAATIFSDDFSGLSTDDLNGTTPDTTTGGATWIASTGSFRADGSITGGVSRTAYLPFTPAAGFIYTLTVTVNNTTVGGDWLAMGFTTGSADPTDDFLDAPGRPFMFKADTYIASALGPGNINGEGYPSTPGPLSIVLDTQPTFWTAEFFINGSSVRGPVALSNVSNPLITNVAIGNFGNAGGSFDDFSLTVIPEPSTALLGGLGLLALLRRRRN